ncbi:MAG: hypothetical protein H8D34_29955, partial [Chloroflexi bacterium]|nr:hypothetical protein [Chloroflexota bacterium]
VSSGNLEEFEASEPGWTFITDITVSVFNGSGLLDKLPPGESMAVIFQISANMLGRDLAIMWWDEARGMWREIDAHVTPDGRCVAITNLTGTFVLVAKD